VVVDTGALLAVVFHEETGRWVMDRLAEAQRGLVMSTVNYAEALILIRDRQPAHADRICEELRAASIRFVPPSSEQAEIAAAARLRFPLNLGDCFAYALAKVEDRPLLTLDRDFRNVDLEVLLPPPSVAGRLT
jgi:ribonuclease VapC